MKDVSHAIQLAKDSGTCLPVAEVTLGHLTQVLQTDGGSKLDWGAIAAVIREAADVQQ